MRMVMWFLLLSAPLWAADSPAAKRIVVLISIDGLRPEFYLEERWPAPTLQHFAREGVHARRVRPVFPSVTYANHTTMITGVAPAKHGVYYNTPFEPDGITGAWYWFEKSIQARTLWDAAREKGLKTASLFWPASVGAPVDINFPELWSIDPDLPLEELLRKHMAPKELWNELEREVTGVRDAHDLSPFHLGYQAQNALIAAHVLVKHRPRLMTLHLVAADFDQHDYGREHWRVRQAVAAVDQAVAILNEEAERAGLADRVAFVITGDHGFVDIHSRLDPNYWLEEAGLQDERRDKGEWRARFHVSSASAFLHVRDRNDLGVLKRVREVLTELPVDRRALFRVLEREELDELGAAPEALLALVPVRGVTFSEKALDTDLAPAKKRGQHGYSPDFDEIFTGFLAHGAGVAQGVDTAELRLQDVAPFVAHLLDLQLPGVEGTLYPGLTTQ